LHANFIQRPTKKSPALVVDPVQRTQSNEMPGIIEVSTGREVEVEVEVEVDVHGFEE